MYQGYFWLLHNKFQICDSEEFVQNHACSTAIILWYECQMFMLLYEVISWGFSSYWYPKVIIKT